MQLMKWGGKLKTRKMLSFLTVLGMMVTFLLAADQGMAAAFDTSTGVPDQIILSWTGAPETTQTIAWRTGSDTTQNRAQYMLAAGANADFTGAQEVTATQSELYPGYFHMEVTLQGLTPGASYVYRVGRDGAWSAPASFTTASPIDNFSFIYMGDVQQGYEDWGDMLQVAAAEKPGPKFAILGGDLVDDSISEEWQQFFAAASPVFKQIPLMPAAGNHDATPLFWNSFALPQNGPEGYEEQHYSFDYGNCHIVVLNSNALGAPVGAGYDKIRTWLSDDLNKSNKQWKFIVLHYPPYPAAPDNHAANLEENWVPIFEQGGVDVVFVGHQHVYMRTKPLRDNQTQTDGQGIVYIMGNAGTKYKDAGPGYDYIAKELAGVSNYEVININGETFNLTAKDAVGQVIDTYTFKMQPHADSGLYTVSPIADANYQNGTTSDGISTMTANDSVYGLNYFSVQIMPVCAHEGVEAVVFVHLRKGVQQSLNVTKADFDETHNAKAGFNVQPGDMVKVYIVDDLTNALDFNPTVLQ